MIQMFQRTFGEEPSDSFADGRELGGRLSHALHRAVDGGKVGIGGAVVEHQPRYSFGMRYSIRSCHPPAQRGPDQSVSRCSKFYQKASQVQQILWQAVAACRSPVAAAATGEVKRNEVNVWDENGSDGVECMRVLQQAMQRHNRFAAAPVVQVMQ